MPTAIAGDLIKAAMMRIGVIASGEAPSNDEYQDCLDAFNDMISLWGASTQLDLAIKENFPLTASVGSYTIGVGKTFNTVKPNSIVDAFIRDSNNYDYPVEILSSVEEYDAIPDKVILTGRPLRIFYDPSPIQQAIQAGTIYVYPMPDVSTYTLFLETDKALTEFTAITDAFTFPLHYKQALKYNLAIAIAPIFGAVIAPEVARIAEDSLKKIKVLNVPRHVARFDYGKKGLRYNINSSD